MDSLRSYLRSLLPSTGTPIQGTGLYTLETLLGLFSAVAGEMEDDMLVLLLCFAYPDLWSADSLPEYVRSITAKIADQASDTMEEELAQAQSAMDIVRVAAEACRARDGAMRKWSPQFVAGVGGKVLGV
ncbi:unnamed protein product [Zymoseptoria tritici ST99CH_1E4]|uniref:Uncharacterized protein n=1 Tax=Zymoseptoria tritici ST99CH_1E4 TaxID=1276532 RepID=A0A2H1G617_ZYMTR|nr:unnamed protein product [Zymoseptoria tritici ST99CH_1E4]